MGTAPSSEAGADVPTSDRVSGFVRLCLFACVLTPLIIVPGIANPFVTTRTIVFRVLVELGLVGFVWLLTSRETRSNLSREPFLWAMAAFVVVAFISAVLGPAPYRSLFGDAWRVWGVWGWFHFLLYYVLLRVFLADPDWDRFFSLVVLVSVCAAGYAILQAVGPPFDVAIYGVGAERLRGTMGNAAFMAVFAFMGLGVTLHRALTAGERRARVVYVATAAVLFPVSAMTGTLSITLALGGSGVVAVALTAMGLRWYRLRVFAGGIIMLVLGAGLFAAVRAAPDAVWVTSVPLLDRMATVEVGSFNVATRLLAWKSGLAGFLDRPVFGWGLDNFKLVWDAHFPPEYYIVRPGRTILDRAHNAYVEVPATLGIAGAAAFVTMAVTLFRAIWSAFRQGRLARAEAILLASLCAGYGAYLVAWFEDINALLLFVAVAAFVTHRAAGGAPVAFDGRRHRRLFAVLVTALTALTATGATYVHGINRAQAAVAMNRVPRAPTVEESLAALARAADPTLPDRTLAFALLTEYLDRISEDGLGVVRGDPYRTRVFDAAVQRGLGRIEDEMDRDPLNSMLRLQQGNLLVLAARFYGSRAAYDAAVDAYRRAIELSPGRIRHRHILASTYVAAGEPLQALRELDAALNVFDGFGETYIFVAEARLAAGDADGAFDALQRAVELDYTRRGARIFVDVADSVVVRGRLDDGARLLRGFLEARADVFSDWRPGTVGAYLWDADEVRLASRAAPLLAATGHPGDARRAALRLVADRPWAALHVRPFLLALDRGVVITFRGPLIPDSAILSRPAPVR